MIVKIFTIATIPQERANAWLQHLRDFDTMNPGCHFEVGMDLPDVSLHEAVEMLRLNPGLTFAQLFKREH
jgi:hypothetical protein